MLSIHSIQKKSGQYVLINNLSMELAPGVIQGILGPNGAGKTTFFSLLMGLERLSAGSIFLDHVDISYLTPAQRIQQGLVYLPQEHSLFYDLNVHDNLECVLELRNIPKKLRAELIQKTLQELSIESLQKKKTLYLSGGQKRRVEFARLILCSPKYVLLDEPFAGVDPLSIEEIKEQIIMLKNKNIGVLISDHHVEHILDLSECVYLLMGGEIKVKADSESFLKDHFVQEAYLGRKTDSVSKINQKGLFLAS
jgi:lipopolysaccharide export system ATP-binding protein